MVTGYGSMAGRLTYGCPARLCRVDADTHDGLPRRARPVGGVPVPAGGERGGSHRGPGRALPAGPEVAVAAAGSGGCLLRGFTAARASGRPPPAYPFVERLHHRRPSDLCAARGGARPV